MARRKKTVLEELERVRSVGPARAETLYDDYGVRSLSDLVELGESGKLNELSGVGKKKASTIISSAKRLAKAEEKKKEAPAAKKPKKTATAKKPAKAKKPKKAAAKKPEKPKKEKKKAGEEPAAGPNGRAPRAEEKPSRPPRAAAAGGVGATAATSMETPTPEARKRPAADERPLKQRFIETLRCPACGHDRFDVGASTLTCQACQRQFNFRDGVVDLAPPVPPNRSLSQKVMESRFYAQFYEDLMRPRLTSIVSNRSMRDEYRLAAEFLELEEDTRLLDVGCGTANFTRYFAQRVGLTDARATHRPLVVGMDLSWSMLDHARRNLRQENLEDKVFLIRGDATRIPVRRGAYNRLHCGGTLHLMSDIDEGLRNFARVLEPNGICVVGTFILGKGLLRRFMKRAAEFPTRFHWFSRDELHRRVERAGFEILDDSVAGDAITIKARRI